MQEIKSYKKEETFELERIQNDLMNLFENFRKEKESIQESQRAILNILDDYIEEKNNLENYQKAILNILYDNEAAKINAEKSQNALMNILDDYDKEKETLSDSQKALLNILDDYQVEKNKVEKTNAELVLSNKELESFSYSVSHDLRAPVRAIHGFTKILEKKYNRKLFDEEGKEALSFLLNESLRMGKLIDDLLTFSRLGKKEIQMSLVDMTALVKEVMSEILKMSIEKYNAKITVNNLTSAYCDGSLIRQIFVNLISNALKFSHQKPKPIIEIGSSTEAATIIYYVKDNGVGFDMKYYDKLFGVFQRLHGTAEFAGTGIGLAIVQRIIIRHGGRVWAEGKVNKGAIFYFSLPK